MCASSGAEAALLGRLEWRLARVECSREATPHELRAALAANQPHRACAYNHMSTPKNRKIWLVNVSEGNPRPRFMDARDRWASDFEPPPKKRVQCVHDEFLSLRS